MVDGIEISHAAYQPQLDYGRRAHQYAAKLATEAEWEGNGEDAEFWRSVSGSLVSRASE